MVAICLTFCVIDEVHRLPKIVEEFLYPAMEDFCIDFIFDKGAHARSHRYRLERFTLVGATTRAGLLSAPLRERFGILRTLDFYTEEELSRVVKRSAAILGVPIDDSGREEIAKGSRGTPRIANRLLKRVRDYAEIRGEGKINKSIADEALRLEGVDEIGLTSLDRRFLETIIRYYKGGPVGFSQTVTYYTISITNYYDSGKAKPATTFYHFCYTLYGNDLFL